MRTPRSIRFSEEEEQLAELAARREGSGSFSSFVREAARERALAVLSEREDQEGENGGRD